MREKAIDRAVEIAPVRIDRARDKREDRRRDLEIGLRELGRGDPRFQDLDAQRLVETAHFDAKAAGEPRAHALLQRLEIARRTIGGDDDLPSRVDQRIERMAELGLNRFALQKLRVVEDQEVDGAQALLEGDRRLRLQRGDEAVHEFFRRQIDRAPRPGSSPRGRWPAADGSCRGRPRRGYRAG